MNKPPRADTLPIPVRRVLRKLGQDINAARRRRRITTALMAERMSVTRTTLHKIEQGDAGVSMGNYATALFVLGLHPALGDIADIKNDPLGQDLDYERLPKRIRHRKT
ncbi:MAG TPA: helix-turn-helix domain-containing protein [Wenzhouxiangella sp.]